MTNALSARAARTSFRHPHLPRLMVAACLSFGCGSSGDDDSSSAGTGGSIALGSGGFVASGGSFTATGGFGSNTGGYSAAGGARTSGGTAGRVASAGTTSQAGIGGVPSAGPDGKSPYQRECHGETAMCVDVNSLRCLGIRVSADEVAGYSCSNPCQTDTDCSTVPSSAQAAPACVDFVTQKHCLLVCQQQNKTFSCPAGMGCYVYPGSTTGYCLWQ